MPRSPAVWIARVVDRPDPLVADRDAVLVHAVLEAPQPGGVRADERGRARVGDPEVLRVEHAARRSRRRARAPPGLRPAAGRSSSRTPCPRSVRTHNVSHTAAPDRSARWSAEPDALVVAAHRVHEQRRRARRRRSSRSSGPSSVSVEEPKYANRSSDLHDRRDRLRASSPTSSRWRCRSRRRRARSRSGSAPGSPPSRLKTTSM